MALTVRPPAGKEFRWDAILNFTSVRNKVVALGNATTKYTQSGRSIEEWYILKTKGIFQSQAEIDAHKGKNGQVLQPWSKPGDIRYVDIGDDGMIDLDEDPYYAGSPWADFETGLQLIASYKKFSVNMQWYAVVGNKLYNRPRYNADRIDQNKNFRSGATFWTAQTPGNEWPRAAVGAPDRGIQYNVLPQSDRWLKDGIYICTGYISRGNGSTFEGSMPPAKKHKVAVYNWGLVDEKSQTIYPWDSWQIKYTYEPALWFHDIFRKDGSACKQTEVDFIRTITEKNRE